MRKQSEKSINRKLKVLSSFKTKQLYVCIVFEELLDTSIYLTLLSLPILLEVPTYKTHMVSRSATTRVKAPRISASSRGGV